MKSRSLLVLSSITPEESEFALVDERDSCSSSKCFKSVDVVAEFGGIPLVPIALDTGSAFSRTGTHDLAMDGA